MSTELAQLSDRVMALITVTSTITVYKLLQLIAQCNQIVRRAYARKYSIPMSPQMGTKGCAMTYPSAAYICHYMQD